MKRVLILLLAIGLAAGGLAAAGPAAAEEDPFAWKWYELDREGNLRVNLFLFYRRTCPHCDDAKEFLEWLTDKYAWVKVRRYETTHSGNLELYRRMAASVQRSAGQVPAMFYCKRLEIGYESYERTGRRIEAGLVRSYEHLQKQMEAQRSGAASSARPAAASGEVLVASGDWDAKGCGRGAGGFPQVMVAAAATGAGPVSDASPRDEGGGEAARSVDATAGGDEELELELPELELPPPEEEGPRTVEVPLVGEVEPGSLSLPALTLVIAACDAFNPCAFFVLLSLLSLLIHARSRVRMLLVGGIFVLFSGVFYFVFMAAWLNVFLLAGHLAVITTAAGLLAIAVASLNIKDYFLLKRGVSLSIPESAKPGLFERMRKLVGATSLAPMLAGTLALAVAANAYELLCTAGFPMVFTRVLTLRDLPTAGYYGYLALYNLIYVVPLATIVGVFTFTLGSRKLQEHEGRILKLLSGVMMLLLGGVILVSPELLQNVFTAGGILAGAVGVTGLVVWGDGRVRGGVSGKAVPRDHSRRLSSG